MDQRDMEDRVKNLNDRVDRMEQILPTLATKADLAAAVAPLATRDELHAVRGELYTAIEEEGARTRQHFDVVAERLEGHIKLIAEGHVALNEKVDALGVEMRTVDAALDRRITRLEASRT